VISIALTDVSGALGISHDSQTWIESLYVSAKIIGMAISPLDACCDRAVRNLERADPVQPEHRGDLQPAAAPGARGRPDNPSADGHGFSRSHTEHSAVQPCRLRVDCDIHTALAATVAALWTDVVDWRFVFLQTIPLCSLAGVLVWYCLHQDQPRYERFRMLDWRAASGYSNFTVCRRQSLCPPSP
jgi:MFS transporter, DHA2 family, multidrug resistance protein